MAGIGTGRRRVWLWLWLLLTPSAATASAPVTVDLLTFNIRNLPGTGFESRRADVEAHLAGFDIVLLQEDFSPPALGRPGKDWRFLARGPEPTPYQQWLLRPLAWASGYAVPYDSGLSTMIADSHAFGSGTPAVSLVRHPYRRCHGWLGHSHDCWVSKGLLGVRLEVANGASVDVYNTHLDAGADSYLVRADQLDELVTVIGNLSSRRAVILAGDFNSPPRRPNDRMVLERAIQRLHLSDTGATASNPASRPCQVVGVFARSGGGVRIKLLRAGEWFTDGAETQRQPVNFCSDERRRRGPSDHPALAVTFTIEIVDASRE